MGQEDSQDKISGLRFTVAGVVSCVIMMVLSYLLHGYLLNDFGRLNSFSSDKQLYSFFVTSYIIIGLFSTFLLFKLNISKHVVLKSLGLGIALGCLIFLLGYIAGIEWFSNSGKAHLLVNLGWQVLEQSLGTVVAGIILYIKSSRNSLFVLP